MDKIDTKAIATQIRTSINNPQTIVIILEIVTVATKEDQAIDMVKAVTDSLEEIVMADHLILMDILCLHNHLIKDTIDMEEDVNL